MPYTTLISVNELADHLDDPDWAIIDCRFSLADPERGRRDYFMAHIPGSIYAHLDEDLCSPVSKGITGRHPLPSKDEITQTLSKWGIDSDVQLIAYDDAGGAMAAARLWWILHWLGHESKAVLDGGWQAWLGEEKPTHSGFERRNPRNFIPHMKPHLLVDSETIFASISEPEILVFDSRTVDRYRGENETIDPVAGHIPGAISVPYPDNLDAEGRFLSGEALHARFQSLLGGVPVENAIYYCGSGVTAAHNLLALAHAGLGDGRLYAGSWSEWITNLSRPVEKG